MPSMSVTRILLQQAGDAPAEHLCFAFCCCFFLFLIWLSCFLVFHFSIFPPQFTYSGFLCLFVVIFGCLGS